MSWNEELKNIQISTLFIFFGKTLLAAGLWYLIALIPWIIIVIIILLTVD